MDGNEILSLEMIVKSIGGKISKLRNDIKSNFNYIRKTNIFPPKSIYKYEHYPVKNGLLVLNVYASKIASAEYIRLCDKDEEENLKLEANNYKHTFNIGFNIQSEDETSSELRHDNIGTK